MTRPWPSDHPRTFFALSAPNATGILLVGDIFNAVL